MKKMELWVRDDQLERWEKQAQCFRMNTYEYMRRAIDAYTQLIKQDNRKKYTKNLLD